MYRNVEYEEPGERMDTLLKKLKGKRSLQTIRAVMSEVLHASPGDLHDFSHKIGNHRWRGTVFIKHNSLMGTVASFFDTKLVLIRGYPKIRYSDSSRVYKRQCITQEKWDGTCFGLFLLPDGTLMGKTRMTEHWMGRAFKQEKLTWKDLFGMIDSGKLIEKITKLLQEKEYIVFGELFGQLNPGDFIQYSVDIDFRVFDIVDRKTNRFLKPEQVYKICLAYDLPCVKETWAGVLTDKEIERIEFELDKEAKHNGLEGFVAKTYIPETNDVYGCKLKCEKIREECWKDAKPKIPHLLIRKAIRKTLENFPSLKTIEEIEPHVNKELEEEVEESLLLLSQGEIRAAIRFVLTPSDEDLMKLVAFKMQEMKASGIDLSPHNKGQVLSHLAKALGDIGGNKLFSLYEIARRQMDE